MLGNFGRGWGDFSGGGAGAALAARHLRVGWGERGGVRRVGRGKSRGISDANRYFQLTLGRDLW